MGYFDGLGGGGFPSLSSFGGGSSGFSMPDMSSLSSGFQPGGILGGSGQGSSWSMPDLGAAWGGGGAGSSFPSLSSLGSYNPGSFSGDFGSGSMSLPSWTLPTSTGSAPSSAAGSPFDFGGLSGSIPRLGDGQLGGGNLNWGGSAPAAGGGTLPSLSSMFGGAASGGFQPGGILGGAGQGTGGFQMPSGFSNPLLSAFSGAQAQPAAAPQAAAPAATGAKSPEYARLAAQTVANKAAAGGGGGGGMSGGPASSWTQGATDQRGNNFNYTNSSNYNGQQDAGLSPNGTVMKTVRSGNGNMVTYDTGIQPISNRPAVSAPAQVARIPAGGAADSVAKQRQGTGTAIQTPSLGSAYYDPAAIEKQKRDSGYYLQ